MSAISTFSINLQRQHLRSIKVSGIVRSDDPIFYLLETILGAYGIQGPESYLYTSRSGCLDVDGINDVAEYSETIVSIAQTEKVPCLLRHLVESNGSCWITKA